MADYHAHGFVDGGYLTAVSREFGIEYPDPYTLLSTAVNRGDVQSWAREPHTSRAHIALARLTYYDAAPTDGSEPEPGRRKYWAAIEEMPDTDLGFGFLRHRRGHKSKEPRQKAVDTLIAADMLVGAFTKIYTVALLVAGDADFVPIVYEVRRCGGQVVVIAEEKSLSGDLKEAADRVVLLGQVQPKLGIVPLQFQQI